MKGIATASMVTLCTVMLAGCVSSSIHEKALADLERAHARLAQERQRANGETARMAAQLLALEGEKAALSNQLLGAQSTGSEAQAALKGARKNLVREQRGRGEAEEQLAQLEDEHQQAVRLRDELRRERDQVLTSIEDLQRRYGTSLQEMRSGKKALATAEAHIAKLEQDNTHTVAALSEARNEVRGLGVELEAERENVARMSEEKQQLMSGTTTAQEEIARLQRRAGTLEAKAALVEDIERRLSERDQYIGTLRETVADRESLASKVVTLEEEVEGSKERVAALTAESATISAEAARTRRERDQLIDQAVKHEGIIQSHADALTSLRDEQGRLEAQLEDQADQLTARDVEIARLELEVAAKGGELQHLTAAQGELGRTLEEERVAREAEIRRLTEAQAALNESLQAEIAKGDIRIQQVRDRLTINMVDRVLFDSGHVEIKLGGLEVLQRVSEVLKNVGERQIRIEGHTDNVPIGVKLREQFPSNWELSTARATSVVRYLVDQGGVDPRDLTAAGHADTRPIEDNETEEGRQANRRIEIVLYPKDLSDIVGDVQS